MADEFKSPSHLTLNYYCYSTVRLSSSSFKTLFILFLQEMRDPGNEVVKAVSLLLECPLHGYCLNLIVLI